MEEKNVTKISLSTFFLILAIIIIIVMGIFIYKLNNDKTTEIKKVTELQSQVSSFNNLQEKTDNISNISQNKMAEEKQDTKANTQVNKEISLITFDGAKSVNSNEKDYTLSCQGNAGIWITVDSTQKVLTFSFTPSKVVEFYSLSWTSTLNDMTSSKINFDKKIVDIFFGEMGQDSSGDTLFILLEDGTVEYIPIVHMFNHTQAEVVSYGKINNISDVIKFTLSSTSDGVTTLAIKSDGSFYDLWYNLKDTGNY